MMEPSVEEMSLVELEQKNLAQSEASPMQELWLSAWQVVQLGDQLQWIGSPRSMVLPQIADPCCESNQLR